MAFHGDHNPGESGSTSALSACTRFILGRQLANREVQSREIGAIEGVPALYVAIASALMILCLSANTSFVGFPQLCRIVAQDGFLPRPFATVGRRLVYSVGILYLTLTAGFLLIVFDGITDRLIPLFAIGAFATFTLSQTGMVAHWRNVLRAKRGRGQRQRVQTKLFINAVGAAATVTALVIIVIAKFTEGGWITIVAIPCVIVLLKGIHRYYTNIDAALRDDDQLQFQPSKPPFVLVMTRQWDRLTDKALSLAMELSPDVIAVHLAALEGPDVPVGSSAAEHDDERERRAGRRHRRWSDADVEIQRRREENFRAGQYVHRHLRSRGPHGSQTRRPSLHCRRQAARRNARGSCVACWP
ncbi:MAG TPA: hypothetical protein VKG24_18495 [Pseudolabrys sp.]|nr:hypothetical protein [Pseudolabrys sp.]